MTPDPPIVKLLPPRQRPQRKDKIVTALVILAIASLIVEYGFKKPLLGHVVPIIIQLATVVAYLTSKTLDIIQATDRRAALRAMRLDGIILVAAALILFLILEFTQSKALNVSSVAIAVVQALLVARVFIAAVTHNIVEADKPLHPARFMVTSFLVIIIVGTFLLALPRSISSTIRDQAEEQTARHVLNCFFTSTSAACVTGLTVYDTEKDFSPFGQFIILCLIQIGGLGIMMFGSVFGMLAGRQLSLRQSLIAQDSLSYTTFGEVRQLVGFVVILTFFCEIIGAAMLWNLWPEDVAPGFVDRLFYSAFHAVSAFCNAGFAINTSSLTQYADNWQVYGSIMPMIVLGGLGFPVLRELYLWSKRALRKGIGKWISSSKGKPFLTNNRRMISLHTRVVLTTTAIMIVAPAILFFLIATFRGHTLADMPWPNRALASLFQSVTARTAGFNTVPLDLNSVSHANHFLLCILMFIGGSPGSTAGGVKTVSFAVLLIGVLSTLRRRSEVEAFNRSIPQEVMRKSAAVIFLMFALVSAVTLLLLVTENRTLIETLFESVSACATVGLSTGMTPELTIPGRIIIIVAMFAGRLGPLTLLVALAGQQSTVRYQYPRESLMIG